MRPLLGEWDRFAGRLSADRKLGEEALVWTAAFARSKRRAPSAL